MTRDEATAHCGPGHLAIPRRGHVVSRAAERYGTPLRAAVTSLAAALTRNELEFGEIARRFPNYVANQNITQYEFIAWHLCARWILAFATKSRPESLSLIDAENWFSGCSAQPAEIAFSKGARRSLEAAQQILEDINNPIAVGQLLPYILDPHGPGSRLSVRRDPKTAATRARKREEGVFYTPADVADYMVGLALCNLPPSHPTTFLDPACGTGVFLRAALSALLARHPRSDALRLAEQSLFGVDIDPWAVDASAYVLLHDVLAVQSRSGDSLPMAAWKTLRTNLAVADALLLDPPSGAATPDLGRKVVEQGCLDLPCQGSTDGGQARVALDRLFPPLSCGARIVIGNPPYAAIGRRPDMDSLTCFDTLRPASATTDIHTLFLEQMVRLSAPAASCSMVLPLSVAFNTRPQFRAARELIQRVSGTWRFSFFDREPHALFGEDVKTRNAIVSWCRERDDDDCRVMTGPLYKWRGQGRAQLFRTIAFTEFKGDIAEGIPKLFDQTQAGALERLEETPARLGELLLYTDAVELRDAYDDDRKTVFVAATAYNFLNVFMRPLAKTRPMEPLTANKLHALRCDSKESAQLVYALLSSETSFWLWHVLGDGFHVTRAFLEKMPIGPILSCQAGRAELASLGDRLWRRVRERPIASCNGGRSSIAFPARQEQDLQMQIDCVILEAADLRTLFHEQLRSFTRTVVTAVPHS